MPGDTGQARATLADATIFAGLPPALLEEVESRARPTALRAGEWLFREGDPAGSLFVVLSGRLEAVAEDEAGLVVLRELGRGDAVGELALLAHSPRSASVRARRDCVLLELGKAEFDQLMRDSPDFARAVTAVLAGQLQASRARLDGAETVARTIAVVSAGGSDARELTRELGEELGRFGPAAIYGPGDDLDRLERDHDRVLLPGGSLDGVDEWTRACLRQADRVLVRIGRGDRPRGLGLAGGVELLVAERGVPVRAWLEATGARTHHLLHVRGGVGRVARRLAGRSLGLVLSGGGARGFAHIGVLEELGAAGVEVDRIAGCSMGAFIGGQAALGRDGREILARCREEFVESNPMGDYTIPRVAVIRGLRARAMLDRTFGERLVEDLEHPFFSVAADLDRSELVVMDRGPLFEAVGASMCLPGIAPPAILGGRVLVDGGVLDNLPVETMAQRSEGPVVAVDVSAQRAPALPPQAPPAGRAEQALSRLRKALTGVEERAPSVQETLFRTVVLGSVDTTAAAERHADLVIAPETQGIGLTQWKALGRLRDAGRRAAAAALEDAPPELFA